MSSQASSILPPNSFWGVFRHDPRKCGGKGCRKFMSAHVDVITAYKIRELQENVQGDLYEFLVEPLREGADKCQSV